MRQNQRKTLHHEKTDWVKFRKIINKNLTLTDAITPAEIDETVNNIANIIKTALGKFTIPTKGQFLTITSKKN